MQVKRGKWKAENGKRMSTPARGFGESSCPLRARPPCQKSPLDDAGRRNRDLHVGIYLRRYPLSYMGTLCISLLKFRGRLYKRRL